MKKLASYLFFIFWLFFPLVVFAHPGRTDSSGCHTCRTNCSKWGLSSGEYHCHRAKSLSQPKEPIKSHFSETGGYTTPAPEYKQPTIQNTTKTNTKQKEEPAKNQQKESWIKKLFRDIFG